MRANFAAHQPLGLGGERAIEVHEIGALQQLVELDPGDPARRRVVVELDTLTSDAGEDHISARVGGVLLTSAPHRSR